MNSGLKKLIVMGAFLIAPFSLTFANIAQAAQTAHPDGAAVTYRGWGKSTVAAPGHNCPLYDEHGFKVGEVTFPDGDSGTLSIHGKTGSFDVVTPGVAVPVPMDDAALGAFPNIPAEYRNGNYGLLYFNGHYVLGDSLEWTTPDSPLARLINVVDARCIYIVDAQGNIVFCLNCIFSFS